MADPLTSIRAELDKLKALDEKAPKGPWSVDPRFVDSTTVMVMSEGVRWPTWDEHGKETPETAPSFIANCGDDANRAFFIAAARTSLPRLAKALERAIKTLDVTTCASKQHIAAEDAANAAMDNARQALADIAKLLTEDPHV